MSNVITSDRYRFLQALRYLSTGVSTLSQKSIPSPGTTLARVLQRPICQPHFCPARTVSSPRPRARPGFAWRLSRMRRWLLAPRGLSGSGQPFVAQGLADPGRFAPPLTRQKKLERPAVNSSSFCLSPVSPGCPSMMRGGQGVAVLEDDFPRRRWCCSRRLGMEM